MSITRENSGDTASAILEVERGERDGYEFGDGGWNVQVTKNGVTFCNDDYIDPNDEKHGYFAFSEFKWALMAWWEFLLLPDMPSGSQYSFVLPTGIPCALERPDRLLIPAVRSVQ